MDALTVTTQQIGNQAIQNTIDNFIDDQRTLKPKERVIQIEATQEVTYQTQIDTKVNFHSHTVFSIRWKWIPFFFVLIFATISFTLLGISLYQITYLQDIDSIQIQDSFYWYITGIQILLILTIVTSLLKFVYFIKQFEFLITLSIKNSSAIISFLCSASLIAWAFYRATGIGQQQICAEDRFKLYDQFYRNITIQFSQSCCPMYPSYYPQWSSFFSCSQNGTDTNCLNTLPRIISGENNQQIFEISNTELQYQCIGICSRGPIQLSHQNLVTINNSSSISKRQNKIIKGIYQDYYFLPCIRTALNYFQNGISSIWKYFLTITSQEKFAQPYFLAQIQMFDMLNQRAQFHNYFDI